MSKFGEPQGEPLFIAVDPEAPQMEAAHTAATATLGDFTSHLAMEDGRGGSIKLRFQDPAMSEEQGEDCFTYLWLANAEYHAAENQFSGEFFELPPEFQEWHQVGERLTVDSEVIVDWMIIHEGHLYGGYTLRVARSLLPASEREEFDSFIGVKTYESSSAP